MEKPKVPLTQVVYGQIVYWLCLVAALICMIGPALAIVFPDNNVMEPHYLFGTLWKGSNPETVWQQVGSGFPGTHFWISNLNSWDGFTQLGFVIGCSSAGAGLLVATIFFLLEKPRPYKWVLISIIFASLIFLSAVGLFSIK